MIRPLTPEDLDTVMDLWLAGNEQAHPFVPEGYWRRAAERIRRELPRAEVLVHGGCAHARRRRVHRTV